MSGADIQVIPDRGVEISQVESALRAMWREAKTTTRACMANLVVACRGEDDLTRISGDIADIAAVHPSRVIVLCASSEAADAPVEASISTYCHFAGGAGQRVCCEQITLRAGGREVEQLPLAVLSLLLCDLPVVVWWRPEGAWPVRLGEIADQLILDTDDRGAAGLGGVLADWERGPRPGLTDLAWARLAPWQEQLARFFDPPERRAALADIDRVVVRHVPGSDGAPGARPMLLTGWLAAALEWSVGPGGSLRGPSGPVRFELEAAGDGAAAGSLRSVALGIGRADPKADFKVWREADTLRASEETDSACGIPWRVAAPAIGQSELVLGQLQGPERDPLYERSLRMAAGLTGAR